MKRKRKLKRLSADEFISEISKAPAWKIIMNDALGEIELVIQHDNEKPYRYLGLNPLETGTTELMTFMVRVEMAVNIRRLQTPVEGE